jgi:hypothetical protein
VTDVIDEATAEAVVGPVRADAVDEELVRQLSDRARAEGLRLTGEGGLLARLTKIVVESALEGEMEDHPGYARHDPAGRDGGNSRNGTRSKELLTEAGQVRIAVPRDRDGSFTPQLVRKRQRRLSGLDDLVISLSAKGLTHGEICAHLAEIYGAEVSKQTISTITEKVLEGMTAWQNRPLDPVYPVIFIDAVNVKIRDGQVANRPIYVALAVTCEGTRDILGLWAGEHGDGEGAKYWLRVLSEIKNRGTQDCLIAVSDGLKGLPGGHRHRLAPDHHPNLHCSPAAQLLPLRVEEGLVRDREGPQARLHRGVGVRRAGPVRRIQREVGEALPGDHPALDQCLGRIRALPAIRPGDPHDHLHDQRH